jgi:hypothetical protein
MLEETTTPLGQPDSKDEETLSSHHPPPQRSLLHASVDDIEQVKNERPVLEASQQGALKDKEESLTESGHSDKKNWNATHERERCVTNISNMSRILPVEVAERLRICQ